jgi:hypothetical protein
LKSTSGDPPSSRHADKEGVTHGERNMGHTKEEYFQISSKLGLPKRCPILAKCYKAVQTKYEMGFRLGGSDISFDEFLDTKGIRGEPDDFIRPVQELSWRYSHNVLTSVSNVCPEVTLFEPDYLPFHFKQSAFKDASFYGETRSFMAEPAHYSECAEFSEYQFREVKAKKTAADKGRKRSHISKAMRFEIFQRDNFRCYYCGRHKSELPPRVHLDLDHKKPHVDGGEDSFENLVAACSDCNNGKANKVISDL